MRVLLVEDDGQLGPQLKALLVAGRFAVDLAADGQAGLFQGSEYPYDAAIIDVGLPAINGIELIRRLRAAGRNFPILILTARGHWQDKVEGLEAGADDYLTKPFQPEELLARLNALLRRAAGLASPELRAGPLLLSTARKRVSLHGQPLELTSYEYNILEYLMLHRGEVISKSTLTEHLYDQDFDKESNVLEVLIGRLRRKLDPAGTLKPITTIRGQGYRFAMGEPG